MSKVLKFVFVILGLCLFLLAHWILFTDFGSTVGYLGDVCAVGLAWFAIGLGED